MIKVRKTILLGIIFCLFVLDSIGSANTLEKELYEVDKLRMGKKTPFDQAEKKCNELLERYTKSEEKGKIYYQLAEVYAQSGQLIPKKTIEFSKKALEYPLDPVKQLQLYVYWGDAIQVAHRGVQNQELVAARRKAVMPYLQGLKEALKHNLPEVKPDLPSVSRVRYVGPPDSEEYRKIKRRNEEQMAAWRLARFQQDMIQHRVALTGQISYMYSRFPFASNEIKELAIQVLEDEKAVERLMSAVNAAVQQRIKELGWGPPPPDITFPTQLSNEDEPTAKVNPQEAVGEKNIPKVKEIFIPKAGIALILERGFVLDFAIGKLLNPAAEVDSEQFHKNLLKLDKGDIAWDGSLLSVRKARVFTVRQESHRPLKQTLGRWCN